MPNSSRVAEILSWYGADNVGTLANLARLMNFGRLAGTGKFVILPVDQGFEHLPAQAIRPDDGALLWVVDETAAARLSPPWHPAGAELCTILQVACTCR